MSIISVGNGFIFFKDGDEEAAGVVQIRVNAETSVQIVFVIVGVSEHALSYFTFLACSVVVVFKIRIVRIVPSPRFLNLGRTISSNQAIVSNLAAFLSSRLI